MHRLEHFLFLQWAADTRFLIFRGALGLVIVVLLLFGPYGRFYVEEEAALYSPTGLAVAPKALSYVEFEALRLITICGGLLMVLPLLAPVAAPTAAVAFWVLNGYVAGFGEPWSYNSHLNFFLILAALEALLRCLIKEPSQRLKVRSLVLAFASYTVALVYLQAGLSKAVHGYGAWVTKGHALESILVVLGRTPISEFLLEHSVVAAFLSRMIVGWEFLMPLALFFYPTRRLAIVSSIVFHGLCWLLLGISFWHFVVFIPILFLSQRGPKSSC